MYVLELFSEKLFWKRYWRVGLTLFSDVGAQGFVMAVTMVREAVDEMRRYQRDKEMNSQLYSKLTVRGQPPLPPPNLPTG